MAPSKEPEKDPQPPGTMQAVAAGLSVASEPGLSAVDRFGPAVAAVAHLAVLGLMMFNLVPNLQVAALVLAFTGPLAAGWAAKLGAKPK